MGGRGGRRGGALSLPAECASSSVSTGGGPAGDPPSAGRHTVRAGPAERSRVNSLVRRRGRVSPPLA